ncbi:protein takeout-like isoform X2 [Zootermopsis nevadensis]|uniref:protein takeout-like isoform X2 n=1 Tax=Zootermopsis nevadensis TaxID=136037 RepID=UPI000B8EE103|nr:protein takeout-like isoform X2 [Zootermopsis nevadensis]
MSKDANLSGTNLRREVAASEFFQICHRSDPDISSCIKNTLEDLRPLLIKGIPELYIVPMDPLNIPRLGYKEVNGNFEMEQILSNVTIHGIGQSKVLDVRMDFDTLTMELRMKIPSLIITADYEMKGKVLALSMEGKGDCTLKFTEVTTTCRTLFEMENRGGQQFLEVKDLKWTLGARNSHFQFNNLFGGDKTLGKMANTFLNENSREAFKTYKHLPEEGFGILFKNISNNVYRKFSFKELFPE